MWFHGRNGATNSAHILYIRISSSVQIWSQQNKWEIHLKVHCVSSLDIQRLTTGWLNRPNKCFIASPGRESSKASGISKIRRLRTQYRFKRIISDSLRPTSNDHVLLLESEHACGDTLSCQIIVFVKFDKENEKCAKLFGNTCNRCFNWREI